MELCKYCNTIMNGEYETLKNKSYNFFYTCPNCKSIYEGTKKDNLQIIKSRWFNSSTNQFENIKGYLND